MFNLKALNMSRIFFWRRRPRQGEGSPENIPPSESAAFKKLWAKPKVIYSILVVLLITSITFYALKEKEKKLRIFTQKQLTQTIEEKKKVESKLVDTVKAKEATEKELGVEKERTLALGKELEEKKYQMKLALDRVEQERALRRKAEAKLMIVLKEKETLETKRKDFKEMPKPIELEKIVVKPGSLVSGKITMVNKEYAFVVVNLGSLHNIKAGDILSVYRNDEFIGKVQIERVEEKMSAAALLPDWQNVEFKEGDVVKTI